MKLYIFAFLAILCAVLYFLTGCASKHPQPLAATTYREAIPQTRHLPPVRPQLSDSAKVANVERAKAIKAAALQRLAAKAQADSLRIAAHTPCPVTEIPKRRHRRSKGCPCP